jgi:hypothetical protein
VKKYKKSMENNSKPMGSLPKSGPYKNPNTGIFAILITFEIKNWELVSFKILINFQIKY